MGLKERHCLEEEKNTDQAASKGADMKNCQPMGKL